MDMNKGGLTFEEVSVYAEHHNRQAYGDGPQVNGTQ